MSLLDQGLSGSRWAAFVGLFVAALLVAGNPQAAHAKDQRVFQGWLGTPTAPTHHVFEGDLFALVFRSARSVRYRVCVERRGGGFSRCWSRRARAGGTSRVRLNTVFLDVSGRWEAPFGTYLATWSAAGKSVAGWRFSWGSEGV